MNSLSPLTRSTKRLEEPIGDGRPVLTLSDDEREALAELLAELLLEAIGADATAEAAP